MQALIKQNKPCIVYNFTIYYIHKQILLFSNFLLPVLAGV